MAGLARAADSGAAAGNIEGTVIVAGSGQPLSGVKLRLAATNGAPAPVFSGADGSFRITGVAQGKAVITAVFPGEPVADWVAEDVSVTVAAGETRKDVLVRALKGGVVVVGVLSRDERKPLADMPVSFTSQFSLSPIVAISGADGLARVRLLPDSWQISANAGSPYGALTNATVVTGRTNQAEVLVDPGVKLTGTVRDPDGAPAAGVVVSLNGNYYANAHEVRTDANGRYELTLQRFAMQEGFMFRMAGVQTYSLLARSEDRNLVAVRSINENTTNQDLTLQPGVTLSAKLKDEAGRPVTNATGMAYSQLGNYNYPKSARPDSQGQIEFAGMPQAGTYYLAVSAKGYGSMNEQMQSQPTNRLEFPTIVMPRANQKLGGTILDADGKPVPGVIVQAVAFTNRFQPSADTPDAWDVKPVFGRSQGQTQTDSQGRFFFDEVCEGPIQLTLSLQNSSVTAKTVGGTTNIVLRLDLSGLSGVNFRITTVPAAPANPVVTITGTVRDPSGKPAPGVLVKMWGDYVNMAEVKTDSDGRYSLNWRKQVNPPALVIFARDLERNLASSHEIDGTTTNVDLTLQPGLTLSVKAEDVRGKPIPTAMGTLAYKNWTLSRIAADAQGLIEIKALPQGQAFSATITSRGFSVAKALAPAEETQTTHFEFPAAVLKVADRQLAGQVLDPDDKPFPKANVDLTGDGQVSSRAITDDQGRFVFEGLCEGTVRLLANGGRVGNYRLVNAQVQSGDTNVVIRFVRNIEPAGSPAIVVNGPMVTNTGTVLDASGAPVSGAPVSVAPIFGRSFEATSDVGGKFSVAWQERNFGGTIVKRFIFVRDEKRDLAVSRDVDVSATNLELRLEPGLTLAARVQDANGVPIPTATASLLVETGARTFAFNGIAGKADAQGVIEIKALPRGRKYSATIAANGYGFTNLAVEATETQTTRFEFPVAVLDAANRKIYGHVLGADSKPVPEVYVLLNGDGQKPARTTSDSRGYFAFYGLSEGRVRVIANIVGPEGNSIGGSTYAQAGDTNVLIRFGTDLLNQPNALIVTTSGTVLDSSGAPVSGARLSVRPGIGGQPEVQSDAAGKYSITWQSQNNTSEGKRTTFPLIQYVLFGHDTESHLVAALEIDDKTTNADLHLQPGLTLSGLVRDDAGQPVTNAVVNLVLDPPAARGPIMIRLPAANTGARGLFFISALPQKARYIVNVAAAGYGSNSLPVPASLTQTNQCQLPPVVLKPANRKLAGQVIGLDGKPCSGTQVTMHGEGQSGVQTVRADSDGQFVIQEVCEGLVDMRAVLPASAGNPPRFGYLQAHGGDTNIVLKIGMTNGVPIVSPARAGPVPTNRPPTSASLQHEP